MLALEKRNGPPKKYHEHLKVALTGPTYRAVMRRANREGIAGADVVRHALERYLSAQDYGSEVER